MPNAPESAARNRTPPKDRRHAHEDREGSTHRRVGFDQINPVKRVRTKKGDA